MDITIGVISFNTIDLLKECVDSIKTQGEGILQKTIVVDNASKDGSQDLIKSKYPQIKLIANTENVGFSKAANQVIKSSKTKFVLILNSDTIFKNESIVNMVKFMKSQPRAGAVGPLLLNPDGSHQMSGRRFPSFLDASMHAFFGVIAPNNRFSKRYKLLDWDRKSKKEVDWVSGAAICVRKEAVERIGFFDEQYFMYVEDMDLCYRLWENGWKVFLLPDAKVIHYIGQSSRQINKKMLREFQRSIYKFFVKQNAGNWKRFLAPLIKAGLSLRTFMLIQISNIRKDGR